MSPTNTNFSTAAIQGDNRGYTAYHAPRYAFILQLLGQLGVSKSSRILDIGSSRLTELLAERFETSVDSLGFGPDRPSTTGQHFQFDLNQAQDEAGWRRDLAAYDVVVMAEVIEHLYTAPQLVLAFVRTLLQDGGLLLIQTPNAASLQKRIKMAMGRNPYEMIRLDTTNPGHFREYTIRELRRLAEGAGFRVERQATAFYFDARYARHGDNGDRPQPVIGAIKNSIYPMLPAGLREGVTMIWRRPR